MKLKWIKEERQTRSPAVFLSDAVFVLSRATLHLLQSNCSYLIFSSTSTGTEQKRTINTKLICIATALDYVSIRRDQNYCFVPNNVYNHALCGLCPQVSLHLALRHQVSEPGGRAIGFVTFTLGGSNYIRHLMTACWVDGTTWTLCAVCPLISPICYYFHKTPPSQETRKRLLNVCQPPSLIWGHKCSIRSNKSNATEAQP